VYDAKLAGSLRRVYRKYHGLFVEAAKSGTGRQSSLVDTLLLCESCGCSGPCILKEGLASSVGHMAGLLPPSRPSLCCSLILSACCARRAAAAFKPDVAWNTKTIRQFDEAVTSVSFGWPSVDAYYMGSSSTHSIPHVRIPLLVIQVRCLHGRHCTRGMPPGGGWQCACSVGRSAELHDRTDACCT
jgi:hypothetical protein